MIIKSDISKTHRVPVEGTGGTKEHIQVGHERMRGQGAVAAVCCHYAVTSVRLWIEPGGVMVSQRNHQQHGPQNSNEAPLSLLYNQTLILSNSRFPERFHVN